MHLLFGNGTNQIIFPSESTEQLLTLTLKTNSRLRAERDL